MLAIKGDEEHLNRAFIYQSPLNQEFTKLELERLSNQSFGFGKEPQKLLILTYDTISLYELNQYDLGLRPFMWRERSYFYDGKKSFEDQCRFPTQCYSDGHSNQNFKKYFYEENYTVSESIFKKKAQIIVYEVEFAFPTFNPL